MTYPVGEYGPPLPPREEHIPGTHQVRVHVQLAPCNIVHSVHTHHNRSVSACSRFPATLYTVYQVIRGGHWHQPLCQKYPTSDIDISYSDIGTKYVGLNPFTPISEEFRYRHQLLFRYQTKSISDIPISKIDKSFPIDRSKILQDKILLTGFVPAVFMSRIWRLTTALRGFTNLDVG
jgi:hypothetical protein